MSKTRIPSAVRIHLKKALAAAKRLKRKELFVQINAIIESGQAVSTLSVDREKTNTFVHSSQQLSVPKKREALPGVAADENLDELIEEIEEELVINEEE